MFHVRARRKRTRFMFVSDGHVSDGRVPNGHRPPSAPVPNGRLPNGHVLDGRVSDGHVTDRSDRHQQSHINGLLLEHGCQLRAVSLEQGGLSTGPDK